MNSFSLLIFSHSLSFITSTLSPPDLFGSLKNSGLFSHSLYGNHLNYVQYSKYECFMNLYSSLVTFCPVLCSLPDNADNYMPVFNQ